MEYKKFKPYFDFCFDEKKIYLTSEGRKKISHKYVSPSKIINFFEQKTEFSLWKSLFLPEKNIKSTTELENYFLLETEIRKYLKDKSGLKLDFFGYGFWEENIFEKRQGVESKLGGVPDGLMLSNDEKIVAVLEIKLNNSYKYSYKDKWFSYFLQTSLYAYLSNVNIGYICVLEHSKRDIYKNGIKNIKLNSPLKRIDGNKNYANKQISTVLEEFEIKYEITDIYENNFDEDTKLHLFKIHFEIKNLSLMFQRMCKWWIDNDSESPVMNSKEFMEILEYSSGKRIK